jgi:hypothetical protein
MASGIDAAGTVVGFYQDLSLRVVFAFYRLSDGTIHRFHPSPDVTKGGWAASTAAVNPDGTIIGRFVPEGSSYGPYTGFIHDRAGNYIDFSPFDAIDTEPQAINSAGVVTGEYEDSEKLYHGFVRDAEGNFTSFDPPGNGSEVQTMPTSMNSSGIVVGYTLNELTSVIAGFLRESNGDMTVLNPAHSMNVQPMAIADDGVVVGALFSTLPNGTHSGFIRDPQGNYTNFSIQNFTFPVAIDPQGSIVGYASTSELQYGFCRLQDGTVGVFSPPNALFTNPVAINAKGDIAGYYTDTSHDDHLFIRINPDPPPTAAPQNENTSVEPAQ